MLLQGCCCCYWCCQWHCSSIYLFLHFCLLVFDLPRLNLLRVGRMCNLGTRPCTPIPQEVPLSHLRSFRLLAGLPSRHSLICRPPNILSHCLVHIFPVKHFLCSNSWSKYVRLSPQICSKFSWLLLFEIPHFPAFLATYTLSLRAPVWCAKKNQDRTSWHSHLRAPVFVLFL